MRNHICLKKESPITHLRMFMDRRVILFIYVLSLHLQTCLCDEDDDTEGYDDAWGKRQKPLLDQDTSQWMLIILVVVVVLVLVVALVCFIWKCCPKCHIVWDKSETRTINGASLYNTRASPCVESCSVHHRNVQSLFSGRDFLTSGLDQRTMTTAMSNLSAVQERTRVAPIENSLTTNDVETGDPCGSDVLTRPRSHQNWSETTGNRISDEIPPSFISSWTDNELVVDQFMFNTYPNVPIRLFVSSERSQTIEVENKLVVYITKEVDSKGAILVLDNMGISLTVPAGAIANGQTQLIILALNWDLSDNPFMEETQALVSPVVYCGPHGIQLKEPALLRYKHCAFDPREIQIMQSQTELTSIKDWNIYCNADEEEGKCKVTQDECQVLLNHFTLFTSLQTPQNGNGCKWLQVAVFSSPLKPGIESYLLRVYFLNKTPCALQWAKHNEAQFNGQLVCPEKVFLLKGNKEDAILKLRYLSKDWMIQGDSNQESVQFLTMWQGMCPHSTFCFQRNVSGSNPKEISLNFSLFQESNENDADKIIIQLAETSQNCYVPESRRNKQGFDEVRVRIFHNNADNVDGIIRRSRANDMSVIVRQGNPPNDEKHLIMEIDPGDICCTEEQNLNLNDIRPLVKTKIPLEVRRALILLLIPTHVIGTDWRDFAQALGFDCISFLQTLPCPITSLLEFFETQSNSLMDLYNIFIKINRLDAAEVIQEAMGTVPKQTCENSDSDTEN